MTPSIDYDDLIQYWWHSILLWPYSMLRGDDIVGHCWLLTDTRPRWPFHDGLFIRWPKPKWLLQYIQWPHSSIPFGWCRPRPIRSNRHGREIYIYLWRWSMPWNHSVDSVLLLFWSLTTFPRAMQEVRYHCTFHVLRHADPHTTLPHWGHLTCTLGPSGPHLDFASGTPPLFCSLLATLFLSCPLGSHLHGLLSPPLSLGWVVCLSFWVLCLSPLCLLSWTIRRPPTIDEALWPKTL